MSIKGIFPIDQWDFNSASVLAGLAPEDLAILERNKVSHPYKKGEVIFREGAYAAGIFYIAEGKVKKYKLDKEGKEHIIYVANKGELIGYHAILSEERYPDSAATIESSSIVFIPKDDFLEAIKRSDSLSRRLLKTLSHEFAVLANSMAMFAQRPVRERLAVQLIILREKYKAGHTPGKAVEINVSRDDLASLTGTARENVVRILAGFKEDGILETNGRKIIIIDIGKLMAVAGYK